MIRRSEKNYKWSVSLTSKRSDGQKSRLTAVQTVTIKQQKIEAELTAAWTFTSDR